MSDPVVGAAVLVLDASGTVESATAAALELLGTTLAQLKSAPRGAFAAQPTQPDEDTALRTQWEAAGSPELAGETTIRRADGPLVRLRYLISQRADGRFDVILEPGGGLASMPASVFALGEVLGQWRAAERRLASVPPDSEEWAAISSEIERLRATYREGYRARRGT